MAEERQWQPTPNGAFVLFGVKGHKDGFGVQPAPDRRDVFYETFNKNATTGTSTGGWQYPYYPQDKRGTWDVERIDDKTVKITLKMGNRVVWTGIVAGSNEVPQEQPDPFG